MLMAANCPTDRGDSVSQKEKRLSWSADDDYHAAGVFYLVLHVAHAFMLFQPLEDAKTFNGCDVTFDWNVC